MTSEDEARLEIVALGRSIFERNLTPGCTGNLSVRVGDHVVATPTGSSLGELHADSLSVVGLDGELRGGPVPTKEVGLHLELYRNSECEAVVHLHSPHAMAYSCLPELSVEHPIPFLTPYLVMRASDLRLVPYHRPGSAELTAAVREAARLSSALLLQRHGSMVAGRSLRAALDAAEEIEQAAMVALLTKSRAAPLSVDEVAALVD